MIYLAPRRLAGVSRNAASIWSGAVSFGLVSIPVRLHPATQSHDLHPNLLHGKDGARIRQRYYCPEDGEIVDLRDVVRGYLVGGRYVALTEDDFAKVPVTSLKTIEIDSFIKLSDIDPIYFQSTYYLEPDEIGAKPFALLSAVLRQSGLVAVAKFTLRTKQHACVIRAIDRTLCLSPLFYRDEVRPTKDLAVKDVELDPALVETAKEYVLALSTEFDHAAYRDTYQEHLKALLEDKVKRIPAAEALERPASTLPDLMEALQHAVAKSLRKKTERTTKRKASQAVPVG